MFQDPSVQADHEALAPGVSWSLRSIHLAGAGGLEAATSDMQRTPGTAPRCTK